MEKQTAYTLLDHVMLVEDGFSQQIKLSILMFKVLLMCRQLLGIQY